MFHSGALHRRLLGEQESEDECRDSRRASMPAARPRDAGDARRCRTRGEGRSDCNCAVPADVYAVLMRAERSDLGEAAARDQLQRANLAALADENGKLRAALTELLACNTEAAAWNGQMLADRTLFDEMLTRSQARLGKAVFAARVALGA